MNNRTLRRVAALALAVATLAGCDFTFKSGTPPPPDNPAAPKRLRYVRWDIQYTCGGRTCLPYDPKPFAMREQHNEAVTVWKNSPGCNIDVTNEGEFIIGPNITDPRNGATFYVEDLIVANSGRSDLADQNAETQAVFYAHPTSYNSANHVYVVRTLKYKALPATDDKYAEELAGVTLSAARIVFISGSQVVSHPSFTWILAHEFGHLTGLPYTNASNNLMTHPTDFSAPNLTSDQCASARTNGTNMQTLQ